MLITTNEGTIIDTDKYEPETRFQEEIIWNGWEMVGRCSQFTDRTTRQTLFIDRNHYHLVSFTVDSLVKYAWVLNADSAVKWLLANNHRDLPKALTTATQSSNFK